MVWVSDLERRVLYLSTNHLMLKSPGEAKHKYRLRPNLVRGFKVFLTGDLEVLALHELSDLLHGGAGNFVSL